MCAPGTWSCSTSPVLSWARRKCVGLGVQLWNSQQDESEAGRLWATQNRPSAYVSELQGSMGKGKGPSMKEEVKRGQVLVLGPV